MSGDFHPPGTMVKSEDIFSCQMRGDKEEKNATECAPVRAQDSSSKQIIIWFKIFTVKKPCCTRLNGSPTLKDQALQNIALPPFQTKFLSPCKCSIDQPKMTYS